MDKNEGGTTFRDTPSFRERTRERERAGASWLVDGGGLVISSGETAAVVYGSSLEQRGRSSTGRKKSRAAAGLSTGHWHGEEKEAAATAAMIKAARVRFVAGERRWRLMLCAWEDRGKARRNGQIARAQGGHGCSWSWQWRKDLAGDGFRAHVLGCKDRLVLLVSCKAIVPLTPFFTEVLYQNMRKVSNVAEDSIHHCSFPEAEGKRDERIERSVSRMMTIIDLARNIRERHNKPLKTPLREMVIVHPNADFLDDIAGKLKEELKTLESLSG
ncbi:hypothetical protein M0R45_019575 [Rubus argutus]|uniref:Methionyl/Valyl/Leucyl/Isoleucyl-tRNA synthetase anticodon-binding domain-containing protein n=1 Tax=Rubus argutus TaxID=59490 RepID=A0AAW1X5R2_RUBAR